MPDGRDKQSQPDVDDRPKQTRGGTLPGLGLALGIAIGGGVGVALDNVALGAGIGVALGVGIEGGKAALKK